MNPTIQLEEWLQVVRREYLEDYVHAGGAAVKFPVACDGMPVATIADRVTHVASESGYLVATVSASAIRIHLIEKLFAAVASQIPWEELATERLRQIAAEHFVVPAVFDGRPVAEQIAEAAGVDVAYVRTVLEPAIGKHVFQDHDLARDFRIAMTWLCRARLSGGEEGATWQHEIRSWLCARVTAMSNLRPFQIYTKIGRTNARHHFESLFTWIRCVGRPGLVIAVDATRLTATSRSNDGSLNYTRSSLVDAYEVFRQFVDTTDHLTGVLIVVATDEGFLDIETGSRGLGAYPALMNRVYDEVRDRNLVNPMASLVRITTEEA